MSAIIHNSFRKFNADNFITSIGTNKVYLMIGKDSAWSGASAGEYNDASPTDVLIPVPNDTTSSPYYHHADMIAAKLIPSSSASHVIKRVDWTSGTVYAEYSHLTDDIIDTNFFVFTTAFRVYKCISNYDGAQSVVEPTGVSTSIIETADNYRWKFMFEVPQSDVLKFVTSDWISVKSPADVGSDQENVENGAVDGSLEHIDVTAGGTAYKSAVGTAQSGSTTTMVLDAGENATDDYYNDLTVYITSGTGSGQLRTITDYDGTTKTITINSAWTVGQEANNTSVYSISPAVSIVASGGSGTGATARVSSVDSGVIKKISMVTIGSGYRFATATVTNGGGSSAVIEPRISPSGGHGKNAVSELGGAFIMLNARLVGNEGSDFPVGDDFRKVHLLANPKTGGVAATSTTYNGAEIDDGSGSIIYSEFRAPITRASDSTEDIKLVVEF
jgi:hypothetical protein